MHTLKETAASVGAAVDNAKAAVWDKVEGMMLDSATEVKAGAAAGGSYSYPTATSEEGQSTDDHQMLALPGHGKGEPTGQVVEGTVKCHPIGKATGGAGKSTTAQNTHVGGAANQMYGTASGYTARDNRVGDRSLA